MTGSAMSSRNDPRPHLLSARCAVRVAREHLHPEALQLISRHRTDPPEPCCSAIRWPLLDLPQRVAYAFPALMGA